MMNLPQVGDVLRWDPASPKYEVMVDGFGPGPFLVIEMVHSDTFIATSLDGSPLKAPSRGNTNYFSTKHLCFDVFLTAARRACDNP